MADPMKYRMPDQVPKRLRRLDDPWGITWRVANVVRQLDVAWLSRFGRALLGGATHSRPIFIIGMPRSGTTFLYHLLRHSSHLVALEREGHNIWRLFHHPRRIGWRSDHVGSGAIQRGERRVINAVFTAHAGQARFVEKSADNAVRAPYLRELFPDSTFVVIKRSPCDVISSYINGWRHPEGRFRSYFVPDRLNIEGYPHAHQWCSTLIEGWRDHVNGSIPHIAFAQWAAYVRAIATARAATPAHLWHELHFEDLLARPESTASALYRALAVPEEPALTAGLADLVANPVNAMSAPAADKWRVQNPAELIALLPSIAPLAATLGYVVDPTSGECTHATPVVPAETAARRTERAT